MTDAPHDPLAFLAGTGEMARLIRGHNWAATPLGPPAQWPQSLRTTVRLMLNTRLPMYLFWGPERLCMWNDAFAPSIGADRHPATLGLPALDVWAEIWDVIGPDIDLVMAGGGATWHDNALVPITRNGRREDVYWTYGSSPIDDDAAPHGVGGVLVACTDVTAHVMAAREHAEFAAARTAERDRLATLFAKAPSFMALLSGPQHRVELANQACLALIGNRDILGRPVGEALPEAAGQGFIALLDSVFTTGQAFRATAARYTVPATQAGPATVRYVDFIYEPVRDDAGEITGIFVEGTDTTDRTKAEQDLRATADLLQTVIEAAPGVIYAKDLQGRMILANSAALDLIGKPWAEVEGRTDLEFLDDKVQAQGVMANDRAVIASGETHVLEEPVGTTDGQPRLFLSTKTPIRDATGAVTGLVGVSVDITSRKRAEQQLQTLNARLEADVCERTAALEQAAEALRQSQKMEAIGQLTGGIAHDFNNMLQGMTSGIALAKRRLAAGRTNDAMAYLDAASEAATRAAALTARLLAFGRRQALDPKPLRIDELVQGMASLIERTLGPAIVLELRLCGGAWPVLSDRNQLENALLNLAINARDAMQPNPGRLTIETAQITLDEAGTSGWDDAGPGDYVRITVADTGTGMTADVLAHAFEPFFTTKPVGQGTGLGLSQTYGFVRQSHGLVRLRSTPGQGTEVHLYLPRGHALPAAPPPAAAALPASSLPPRAARILLVDDEAEIRAFAAESLREAGYDVLDAADGAAALRLLETDLSRAPGTRIDILVADVGLPGGLNGRQLADAVRARLPDLPVLLITGYAGEAIAGPGRLAPGMGILVKPFDLATLAARVRGMLDPASAA